MWSRALLLLALPGCLVSFNDYPLGDPQATPGSSGKGSSGGASVGPKAGASSSGGSAASSGGTSSASGSPDTGGTGAGFANPLLVDDFEDGNQAIVEQQGRNGSWYVANDGKGTQTPHADTPLLPSLLEPPRAASTRAAHTYGGPFPTWGALIGTTFASDGDIGVAYDLSRHQGLRLWVRGGGMVPNAVKMTRLSMRTPATIMGGGCTVCSDHFGVPIPLTSQWTQIEVPFSTFKQIGYGRPILPGPDLNHALGIELLFPANVAFDLWIDDVEFY